MARKYMEIVSTPKVLQAQHRYYGRARPMEGTAERDPLGPTERQFIGDRDSFYLATVSESGWPYVQHRGGLPGFLRVLGSTTLAFGEYAGNRQMISTGNLAADDRVSLFLMDYPNRRRLKVLGRARVEDASTRPDLISILAEGSPLPIERAVLIDVVSFDWNCPKYITPRFTAEQVASVVEPLEQEIEKLRAQLAAASQEKETSQV